MIKKYMMIVMANILCGALFPIQAMSKASKSDKKLYVVCDAGVWRHMVLEMLHYHLCGVPGGVELVRVEPTEDVCEQAEHLYQQTQQPVCAVVVGYRIPYKTIDSITSAWVKIFDATGQWFTGLKTREGHLQGLALVDPALGRSSELQQIAFERYHPLREALNSAANKIVMMFQ